MRTPCDEIAIQSARGEVVLRAGCERWILIATILGSSMAFIDSTVVNVALPALQQSFQANVVDVQWVVESYGLFLGALILVGGSLGDSFGRRKMFNAGIAVFAIASIACGLATSIRGLVVARSVQGVGAAFLVPGSLSLISASFAEKTRGQAIGTWSGFTAMTTAIGPVIGGWLIQHASWRWVFFINIPMALAVLAVSFWRVPESRSSTAGGIDWLGTATAILGLGGIVYGLITSVELGWRSIQVEASLALGIGASIAFVLVERQAKSPMLPLEMFRSRAFTGANLLTLFLYAAIGAFFFLFPMNLIQMHGYSATQAGAASLPLILLMFVLSRWSGGLVVRRGARLPLVLGPLIVAIGFTAFLLTAHQSSYWKAYFPAFLVLGFGMSVTVAPLTTVVMSAVDQDRAGTASGINNAVARVAGVLAIAVLGIVMVHTFLPRLESRISKMQLSDQVVSAVKAQETRLAGLEPPRELDPRKQEEIRTAVRDAFLFGFQAVMFICAGLAIASAAVAWSVIPARDVPKQRMTR